MSRCTATIFTTSGRTAPIRVDSGAVHHGPNIASRRPRWETVLDVDALARDEKENWVWKNAQCLPPRGDRCLISLSRGGGDAIAVREFDLARKEFVTDGFVLPEAKSDVEWRDRDTIYVGTDFGPGTMTDSGYARIVKRWDRGTPLAQAVTIFEGQRTDVGVDPWVDHDVRDGATRDHRGCKALNCVLQQRNVRVAQRCTGAAGCAE